MSKPQISESLRRFLKEKIQTALRLEILLLLHHHRPSAFTAPEVASQLGFENDTTAHELMELEAIGVVVAAANDETRYRYDPQNTTLRTMVERLASGYSSQRIPILSVILAGHSDRTRRFTEAFKIISRND
jgi:hypothetical protein